MSTRLIGQPSAEATLARAIAQGRVSHAYLFIGPHHVGKQTAALLFAQALNCTSVSPCLRVESLAACGECEDCRRIAAGTHPDVHVILPGSKSGQNISVEQMRDLRQDVARRPIMGRRKLYLIPAAEAMNEEAANTVLKTLEEPPEYVTLIMMATSPTRVLPTILSRCQAVRFGLVAREAIRDWLAAEGVPPDSAEAVAVTAGGRPGLARRWSQEPAALERRRDLLVLLGEISRRRREPGRGPGETTAALRLAERSRALAEPEEARPAPEAPSARRGRRTAAPEPGGRAPTSETRSERSGLLPVLEIIRTYYRDLLLLAQDAPEALVANADVLPELREAGATYSPAELLAALSAVDRCQQFLERNVAPQLALESLFMDLLQPDARTATGAGARR